MDDRDRIAEVIDRMARGEPSLHSKTVGRFKLVRLDTLPKLMVATLKADVKSGKLRKRKTINRCEYSICILEDPR